MKYISTSLFLCLFALTSFAQRFDIKITVDSEERFFIVSKPSGTPPPGGYPLVFMFHGSSGDGEKFYNISGWKEKGEEEKIITVFPSSLEWCIIDSGKQKRTTKWVNGDLLSVACPGQTFKDDVHFVRVMLDTIAATIPIDRSRVYGTGFSNGGCFTAKLAVEASDIFAAIATASGPMVETDSGTPKRMIPIVYSIGTMDDRFYTAVGLPEIPFNDSGLYYAGFNIKRFLGCLGLNEEYTKDSTALFLSYNFKTLAATASWEFNYILFKGLSHQYPNGINYPATAANFLWDFFQKYRIPSAVERAPANKHITLWPNPAGRFVTVEGNAKSFILRSLYGTTVFESPVFDYKRIELPQLTSGIYFAEIETAEGVYHEKLIIE